MNKEIWKYRPVLHWNNAMKSTTQIEEYPPSSMYKQQAVCGMDISYSSASDDWWTTDTGAVTCEACHDRLGLFILSNTDLKNE